jgi:hypothetical protein
MASTRLAASGVASPQPAARAHPPGPGTPLRFSRPWSRGTTEQQSPPRSLHLGNRSRRHHGVRHAAEFGDAFARACARRIDALEEDILEIADQTEDDYRETLTGRMVPNKEVVLRSKVRIEARQWLMSKRDPKKWGDRQSVDVTANIMLLTPDETSAFAPEGFCPWRDRRRGWVAERKPPRRAVQPKKRGRSGTADGASAVALQNCLA